MTITINSHKNVRNIYLAMTRLLLYVSFTLVYLNISTFKLNCTLKVFFLCLFYFFTKFSFRFLSLRNLTFIFQDILIFTILFKYFLIDSSFKNIFPPLISIILLWNWTLRRKLRNGISIKGENKQISNIGCQNPAPNSHNSF